MVYILIATFCGVLLSGVWFGLRTVVEIIANRTKIKCFSTFSVVISAIIPLIIIFKYYNLYWLNYKSIVDWKNWLLVLAVVGVTSGIISVNKQNSDLKGLDLFKYAIDGIFMEIPQRLMMQTFVCLLLSIWNMNIYFSVPITAIIWCMSICIQYIILRIKFDSVLLYEVLASFVFSIGVGYVLIKTEFIGFTMIAHFMERMLSTMIRKKWYNAKL